MDGYIEADAVDKILVGLCLGEKTLPHIREALKLARTVKTTCDILNIELMERYKRALALDNEDHRS